MKPGEWIRPPRHLLVLFVAVTAVSTAALGGSSWQLVRQDRDLARQRAQERRDGAAALAVSTLQRALETLESQLTALAAAPRADLPRRASDLSRSLPGDAVLLVMRADEVDAYPVGRLLYYPVLPLAADIPAEAFAAADAAEFQTNDSAKAISLLRATPASAPPAIRAEVLLRIARILRKAGRWQEAIATYEDLVRLGDVGISGVNGAPAGLVARAAICEVLAEHNHGDRLARETRALDADLQRGRWRVLRPVYDTYSANARRWLGADEAGRASKGAASAEPASADLVLSETAWSIWHDRRADTHAGARSAQRIADTSVLVVQYAASDVTVAVAARPSFVESNLTRAAATSHASDARITVADADGLVVVGAAVPAADYAVRLASATGLPWTIYATSSGDSAPGRFTLRRQVVFGLSAIVLLVSGGSYLIGRAVLRELRVARLQSDFVSAVSHEFRTPLTAIRQMSELLVAGRVANDDLRQQYYDVLQIESSRLQRLVEGLLKFGRMEAEAMPFRFEPVETDVFVRDVVSEFRREAVRQGYEVVVEEAGPPARVSMDREALACAVWNLLDNAVKYSPECRTIWVSLERAADRIAIRVRDRGVGIPDADRSRIFDKFVRGDVATSLGVQGTGIGLAVARQIVLRHGGDVTVESVVGAGSVFAMWLPTCTP